MVKYLMASQGEDARLFGAHSLRIGGATAALAAGIQPATIRLLGRWSSDCYQLYVRMTRQAASSVGVAIGSTSFDDIERRAYTSEELVLPSEFTYPAIDFDIDDLEADGAEEDTL